MISPLAAQNEDYYTTVNNSNYIGVFFSNLIYNEVLFRDSEDPQLTQFRSKLSSVLYGVGNYTKPEADNAARPFYCTKLSYEPDISLGFFEHDNMIFAKKFSISLKLIENYTDAEKAQVYYKVRGG